MSRGGLHGPPASAGVGTADDADAWPAEADPARGDHRRRVDRARRPEAQLYFSAGDRTVELVGSFATSFREDDTNDRAWPVPNVIGVMRK